MSSGYVQPPANSTGVKVETTNDGSGVTALNRQVVNIGDDAGTSTNIAPVSATNGLAVDPKTLPPGAATATKQDTGNTSLTALAAQSLDYDTGGGTAAQVIFGVALPASGGPVAGGTATNPIQVSLANTGANGTAVVVSAETLPLPTGAAAKVALAIAAIQATASGDSTLVASGTRKLKRVEASNSHATTALTAGLKVPSLNGGSVFGKKYLPAAGGLAVWVFPDDYLQVTSEAVSVNLSAAGQIEVTAYYE